MKWNRLGLVTALIALAIVPPAIAGKRLTDAKRQRDVAQRSFESALGEAHEVFELRAKEQRVETRQRPQEHVLAQVNAALAHAGVPARRMQGLRPESDVALQGNSSSQAPHGLRRQSLALSFQQMSLPELGAFLAAWREQQAMWTPTRIELSKARSGAGRSTVPESDLYDVSLVVSAVYLDESQ